MTTGRRIRKEAKTCPSTHQVTVDGQQKHIQCRLRPGHRGEHLIIRPDDGEPEWHGGRS